VPPSSRSQTVAATLCPQPISRTWSVSRMPRLSTTRISRAGMLGSSRSEELVMRPPSKRYQAVHTVAWLSGKAAHLVRQVRAVAPPCVSNPLAKKRPAARPMRDRYFGPGPLSSSPAAADSRAASGSKYLQLHAASGVVKRSRFARTGHSGVPASPPCLRTSHGTAPYTTTDRCPTRPYLPQVLCSASGVTPRRAHRRVRLRPWAAPERRLGRAKWGRVSRLR
jgi:hypothetical protein